MARITVNLSDVTAFENLPIGEYLGDISQIKLQPTDKQGKFDQIQVTYIVVDGDLLGRSQSEWLSLSPKAAFRLKKWFAKFDLGDVEDLEFDDETDLLTEPDLAETRVIFKVYQERDKRVADETADDAYSIKATLVSVEDDDIPAPKAKSASAKTAKAEPIDEKAAKRAELAAQLAALEDDDDDAEEEEKEPAKPVAKAKAVAAAPKRSLR